MTILKERLDFEMIIEEHKRLREVKYGRPYCKYRKKLVYGKRHLANERT